MSDLMIKASNLSKRYRIGASEKGYKTFREAFLEGITFPIRNLHRLRNLTSFNNSAEEDVIWALKNVSFEVNKGEVLGIIGRNGAGKTTLLKVLSRITEPTSGQVDIYGRVSSLLEVGIGFHPELTGRENIFLNGAILGMRKSEIEKKFTDIVNFAEIEQFLDTPVKRYSSGMYVRLAFAVAAHLDPDVLIVDEVLAVGDIAFQKKCLGKMEQVAQGGRTVLFVSHNMGAVRSLCQDAIWLDGGKLIKRGSANEVVSDYISNQTQELNASCLVQRNMTDQHKKDFYFSQLEILNINGERSNIFKYGEMMTINVFVSGEPSMDSYAVSCHIHNELGQLVTICASEAYHGISFSKDTKKVSIDIGQLSLTSGRYSISLLCWHGQGSTGVLIDQWDNACTFHIAECMPFRPGYDISTVKGGVCIIQQKFRASE